MTSTPDPTKQEDTFSAMSVADVEAIGAHCQAPYCRQLDFLPFKCESCKGSYCLDHRTESAHACPKEGEWARRRAEANRGSSTTTGYKGPTKPHILSHEQQCSDPSCKTLINTPLVTGVHCDKCRRSYCLKHRFTYEHNCSNLTPLGSGKNNQPTQKEKGLAALDKLKAWGLSKKAALPKPPSSVIPQTTAKKNAAASITAINTLKRTSKGDGKIPLDKRIYLHIEASSDTITAKIPKGNFFYSVDYSVGRVLDLAAKSLQVQNVNNRSESEEDKLRVFHVEGGTLLDFGEKVGQRLVTGNTIVLLRGVGAGMAKTPDQMTG
ncbi:Putative Zinc finger, AN1-type, AN1-like Zinc finger [Septoria linicola]|uniref:Zinc finger, AN1-type, AN1-like Zinc finger n=1 Tax=Septoria linicola TaxID=215465 RepID=A0A9Q9ASI9_9PEZI|nr:putative Zinc finger, AN1-type, AN1-like Zinc finger [Septoria linicola]USW54634.1 Putative Zinc finger, AN1-type, AN1-like Zinc finger [Septoria linicola]